jgi:hypothetical protein
MSTDNGWNEWSKHVLAELIRLNTCYDDMSKNMNQIRIEIAMLQVKSGIWGAIGGCIPVIITILIYIVAKR